MTESAYRRRSARVLVVDGADRILLLRFVARHGNCWLTPGGGVNEGEPLRDAATRELREEIGLVVEPADLGDPVAHTSGHATFSWAQGMFRDDFFLYRVDRHEVDTSGMEVFEYGKHGGHRWWSVDELAATSETVYPLRLAGLVVDILAGELPREPVVLPWHH